MLQVDGENGESGVHRQKSYDAAVFELLLVSPEQYAVSKTDIS